MTEKIKDGLHTEWYDNGHKKEEGTYKDGKKDGLWTGWYENGQKKAERNFKDGGKDGIMTMWFENGKKEMGHGLLGMRTDRKKVKR